MHIVLNDPTQWLVYPSVLNLFRQYRWVLPKALIVALNHPISTLHLHTPLRLVKVAPKTRAIFRSRVFAFYLFKPAATLVIELHHGPPNFITASKSDFMQNTFLPTPAPTPPLVGVKNRWEILGAIFKIIETPKPLKPSANEPRLTDAEYRALARWLARVAITYTMETVDKRSLEDLSGALGCLLQATDATHATTAYAVEIFRELWLCGDQLHEKLVELIDRGGFMPEIVQSRPVEVFILGTFYWALWVATVTLTDGEGAFPWLLWLSIRSAESKTLQKAVLQDLGYSTVIPRELWISRLQALCGATMCIAKSGEFDSILRALEKEVEWASKL